MLVTAPSHRDGEVGLRRDKITSKSVKNNRLRTHVRTHRRTHARTFTDGLINAPSLVENPRKGADKKAGLAGTCTQVFVDKAVQNPSLCLEKVIQTHLTMTTPVTLRSQTLLSPAAGKRLQELRYKRMPTAFIAYNAFDECVKDSSLQASRRR